MKTENEIFESNFDKFFIYIFLICSLFYKIRSVYIILLFLNLKNALL